MIHYYPEILGFGCFLGSVLGSIFGGGDSGASSSSTASNSTTVNVTNENQIVVDLNPVRQLGEALIAENAATRADFEQTRSDLADNQATLSGVIGAVQEQSAATVTAFKQHLDTREKFALIGALAAAAATLIVNWKKI